MTQDQATQKKTEMQQRAKEMVETKGGFGHDGFGGRGHDGMGGIVGFAVG